MGYLWPALEAVLLAAAAVVVAWVKHLLGGPEKPGQAPQARQGNWRVVVESATRHNADYRWLGSLGGNNEPERVHGETAVALRRGDDRHPIGIAKIADEDFDEQLTKLIHLAEERATTLNAYSDGMI